MKNVQTYLKELDREKLIDCFLERDPVPYHKPQWADWIVADVTELCRKEINDFIGRLCSLEIKPSEYGECLLFVHYILENLFEEPCFSLVHMDEFKADPYNACSYAYEFRDQAEIVGFLVADTPMTQEYIYELMADVMYEASFYGFEQEDLPEEFEKLREAVEAKKALEEGNEERFVSLDEVKADLGWNDNPVDEEAENLRHAAYEAVFAYNRYSDKKERTLILNMLTL